jgi:hypothetical protein
LDLKWTAGRVWTLFGPRLLTKAHLTGNWRTVGPCGRNGPSGFRALKIRVSFVCFLRRYVDGGD